MVLLAIVHNSAMNMRMLITSRNPDSTVFGYIPRCEIVGSYVIFFLVNSALFSIVASPL